MQFSLEVETFEELGLFMARVSGLCFLYLHTGFIACATSFMLRIVATLDRLLTSKAESHNSVVVLLGYFSQLSGLWGLCLHGVPLRRLVEDGIAGGSQSV